MPKTKNYINLISQTFQPPTFKKSTVRQINVIVLLKNQHYWKNVNQQCKKSLCSETKEQIFVSVSRSFFQNCYFSKWDHDFFKFFLRHFPKIFPCDECDKLLSSRRALNDHRRKKHNCQDNLPAKIFRCGLCEVSFAKSCNLLRHLKSQHESGSSYRCFSCLTYFGEFEALIDHEEQYHHDISSSTANVDFSDLLDFTTEAVNSKFRINRLKFDDSGVLEPFNYLILVR